MVTIKKNPVGIADIPVIKRARSGKAAHTLVIDWRGGGRDTIHFAGLIASDHLFATLGDLARFAAVEVINWGGGVSWGDGIELSGTTLRRMAEAQRPMTGDEFAAFQMTKGISNQETADLLARSISIVKQYKAGRQPIPLTVATTLRAMVDPVIFAAHYRPRRKAGRPRKQSA